MFINEVHILLLTVKMFINEVHILLLTVKMFIFKWTWLKFLLRISKYLKNGLLFCVYAISSISSVECSVCLHITQHLAPQIQDLPRPLGAVAVETSQGMLVDEQRFY